MPRAKSTLPNTKHTPDTMREEYARAKRSGSKVEMADLTLLIANAERPKGAPLLPGVLQARNRQGQRRYSRDRTKAQHAMNPERRDPIVGDYVRVPNDEIWLVTSVVGDLVRSDDQPGCLGFRYCPIKYTTIVDGPVTTSAAPAQDARAEACEALYQATWDAFDAQDWPALERALRAYEATLAALGV